MVQFAEEGEPAPHDIVLDPAHGTAQEDRGRATWHLWAVGGVSLAWNMIGATHYTFSQLRNRAWLGTAAEKMGVSTADMIAYLDSFPAWTHAFWALGVWGAVLGSILLLTRSRQAVWAFAASLLGLAVTQFYRLLAPQPDWVGEDLALNLTLWSVATFLLIYAASMRNKGVLR